MNKELARQRIADLVEKFRPIADQPYNERETQLYFILPLFRALGWNIESAAEVSAEEQISRGFVDFGFYIHGTPAFYVETKRLSEHLNNPEWGRQAMNYSYLRDVPWAVLTDFKHLRVYNAEWQEKVPARAMFLDLHWERYATDDFEKLWYLSRPMMKTRAIDEFAESVGKRTKKNPVTTLLFAQFTMWRRDLFKELRGTQPNAAIDEAIQRFLDRLVFIRTVEDRGVEQPRLQALLRQHKDSKKKKKNLFHEIQELFQEMEEIYNANIFSTHALDMMQAHDEILLERIITGLYDAPGGYNRYDFNAISADILGSIYEQYLSFKAIDPDGKKALDITSDRKTQGIFYTPQYVVRYIVQQTLGKLLEEGADPHGIRILDPACGSGSFLLEAFDVLDRHLAQHGTEEDRNDPRWRRQRILQENLYGVDLDPQAVEVARLNLLLRAATERIRLPMLHNLKVGNSLIDDPDVAGDRAFIWQERFPEVMANGGFDVVVGNPPYVRIQSLVKKQVNWLGQHYHSAASNYDLYVPFIERGLSLVREKGRMGFIVPHKFFQAQYGKNLRHMISEGKHLAEVVHFGDIQIFKDATTYTCLLMLSKEPSESVRFVKVENLKAWIDDSVAPKTQIPATNVNSTEWNFVVGDVYSLFYRLKKAPLKLGDVSHSFVGTFTGANDVFVLRNCTYAGKLVTGFSKTLNQQVTIEAEITKPFLAGKQIRAYAPLKPSSALIIPYQIQGDHSELMTEKDLKKKYPKVYKYLVECRAALDNRAAKSVWYAYSGQRSMTLFQKEKLIVPDYNKVPSFTFDHQGHYFQTGYGVIHNDDHQLSPLYTLGLLNSKLIFSFLKSISTMLRGGYVRFWSSYLDKLPYVMPSPEQHDRMVQLVQKMLDLRRKHADAEAQKLEARHDLGHQIIHLEKQIDALVYELYGMTEAEITLVQAV